MVWTTAGEKEGVTYGDMGAKGNREAPASGGRLTM